MPNPLKGAYQGVKNALAGFKNWYKSLKHKSLYSWIAFAVVVVAIAVLVISLKGWNGDGVSFFFRNVFLDNFLGIPAILLGFLTLVGYVVLGRGWTDSIIGALKTMVGYLLLAVGSSALIALAAPIFNGLRSISTSAITPLDPYLGWTSSNNFLDTALSTGIKYSSWTSFAVIIGFAVNILLIVFKRWTNVRSLMVTGHIMFQQSAILTAMVYLILFQGYNTFGSGEVGVASQVGTFLISGLSLGVYWACASTATIKGTQKITDGAGFANGHQQMWGAALAYKIGRFFGKASESAETKKVSKRFKIFEDNIFTQICIVVILFLILIIILKTATPNGFEPTAAGSSFASWNQGSANTYWLVNAFLGSLRIIAALIALNTGVRMFVTELQQAFQGISQKIIPGSVVAVDTAAVFGFAPNAVTYGFLAGVISQFTAVGIIIGISIGTGGALAIVVPLFITLFFNSGTIGVYANASGGYKAALIVPAIFGFVELFAAAGAISVVNELYTTGVNEGNLGGTAPFAAGYIGMFDNNFIWGLVFVVGGQHEVVGWIVLFAMIAAQLALVQLVDSGMQEKATLLQRTFKLKPKLVQPVPATS